MPAGSTSNTPVYRVPRRRAPTFRHRLLGTRIAEAAITDPAWPGLVAVVTADTCATSPTPKPSGARYARLLT
ncbi:hypothetical protein [Mycobacterium servetii]|uniref:Uncharacterized protein n=1 Tax=Mycobacterium servetii TaxID=3237418 RepID=A0ABV4BYX2_9MYCO